MVISSFFSAPHKTYDWTLSCEKLNPQLSLGPRFVKVTAQYYDSLFGKKISFVEKRLAEAFEVLLHLEQTADLTALVTDHSMESDAVVVDASGKCWVFGIGCKASVSCQDLAAIEVAILEHSILPVTAKALGHWLNRVTHEELMHWLGVDRDFAEEIHVQISYTILL